MMNEQVTTETINEQSSTRDDVASAANVNETPRSSDPNVQANTDKQPEVQTGNAHEVALEDAQEAAHEAALAEANDKFLRLAAEFENFKRQAARREQEARERAARNVIEDLLPVLDNFERAVEAAKTAQDVQGVRMGVEFIAQQFRDMLKNHGVEPIETQGQAFDPLKHDALEEIESDQPAGTIVNEAQRGYLYNGQVLRASRVRVAGK